MEMAAQPILTLLLALLVAPGCASNRVADLQDCGRVSIGFGLGLGAHVKAGALSEPSLGVALVCVSLRVGLNPLEIADWLFGYAGLDFAGDDSHREGQTGGDHRGQT